MLQSLSSPHRIVVLVVEPVLALDLGIPLQVFGRPELSEYSITTASASAGPIRVQGGMSVVADDGLDELSRADTVIVPGFGDHTRPLDASVVDALRSAAARGARMVSICTGAFALAQAGILDGRPATTHWQHCEDLRRLFPAVRVDPHVLYIDDGTLLTSAGVAAGIDLCLHIIRSDLGAAVANSVARRIVAQPQREGRQSQFIELAVPDGDDQMSDLRDWMLRNLEAPVTVRSLAGRAHMSERSFSRHFTARTGLPPLRWLLTHRVERAKILLETTPLSVDEIAARCGLGSRANFRAQFKKVTSVPPTTYRTHFGAPDASDTA